MRYKGFVAFSLFMFAPLAPAFAAEIINAGANFQTFLNGFEPSNKNDREQRWEEFERHYTVVYDEVIYQKRFPGAPDRIRRRRDTFYDALPSIKKDMVQAFSDAPGVINAVEARYRQVFADMPADISVYLLPSLLTFNSKTASVSERPNAVLILGIDSLAQRKDDLEILVGRELFHPYQARRVPTAGWGKTMATPLWREGFATYVSGLVTDGRSDGQLLGDSGLASKCANADFVRQLATAYQSILNHADDELEDDWFSAIGTTDPVRRGYCLGLKVVREIARTSNVAEMAGWDEGRFSAEVAAVLARLSTP